MIAQKNYAERSLPTYRYEICYTPSASVDRFLSWVAMFSLSIAHARSTIVLHQAMGMCKALPCIRSGRRAARDNQSRTVQKRADLVSPHKVHDLSWVRSGIAGRTTATHQHNEQKRRRMDTKQARRLAMCQANSASYA